VCQLQFFWSVVLPLRAAKGGFLALSKENMPPLSFDYSFFCNKFPPSVMLSAAKHLNHNSSPYQSTERLTFHFGQRFGLNF